MKLTQATINKMRPPEGADKWIADDAVPGLGIRYQAGRGGTFTIKYSLNGRPGRMAFESIARVSLDDARTWARERFGEIARGNDPVTERKQERAKTRGGIVKLIERFLKHQEQAGRAKKYIEEQRRSLMIYFRPLHHHDINQIVRRQVAECLSTVREESGPVAGDRSRAHLSAFFNWAIAEGLVEGGNPVTGTIKIGGLRAGPFVI
jgi:hypothetical protein